MLLGRCLLNQIYIYFLLLSNLPRFPHHVYNFSGVSCASSPLLRLPRSSLSSLVTVLCSFAWFAGLAGASSLAPVVASYSLVLPHFSLLPNHLCYNFVGFQALSPLYPHVYHCLYSRSRSCPYPCGHSHSRSCPRSRLRPCSRHRLLVSVFDTLSHPQCHTIGRAPDIAPEASSCLHAWPPLSTEMMPHAEWHCLVLNNDCFLM